LPTVAESGLPGFEAVSNAGIFAPARTPKPIIDKLNQEIVRALARPDVKEKFLDSGVDTVGSTPAHLEAAVKAEMSKMGKVIKDAGIREE
jgi:tripartite-type tricarboxylate transporter receptor subunit TctC